MLFSFSENSKILCTETCFSDRSIRYPRNLRKWGTFSATKFNKNKSMSQKYRTTPPFNLYLQDLISNSPFLLLYISFKTGLENLMLGKMASLSWSVSVFSSPVCVLMLWYCKGEATWKLSLPYFVRVVGLSVMQTWLLNNSLFWISRSSPYFVITLFNLIYSWQRPQAIWSESLHLICYLNGQHGPIFPAWDHLLWSRAGEQILNFCTMSAMESPKAAGNSQGWRVANTVGFLFQFLREMGHFAFLSERNIFAIQ